MGLFDRFIERKRVVTSHELAAFLSHAALQLGFKGDQSLRGSLDEQPESASVNPFELLVVAALPLDMLVVSRFKSRAEPVRAAFKDELVNSAKSMVKEQYAQRVEWSGLSQIIEERFIEYGQLMHAAPGAEGLRRYSLAAAERVTGTRDPLAAGMIASHFSLTLNHMGDALEQYQIA